MSRKAATSKHVLSVTVRDQPGVLVRIAGLFARRGFNIESLSVAQTEKPGISRTTFVIAGEDDGTVEQVQKQLHKLVDVLKVIDHSEAAFVDRELMLIKVSVQSPEDRVEIRQIAQDFRARIVDVHRDALIFELTGDAGKMNAFIDQMSGYGILELNRTGRVALTRSAADVRGGSRQARAA
ncbi:MAG TPA: acetolactate synthase small subunit [Trueperaceae bacterium]